MISTIWGVATDVGLTRAHNEDALLAQFPVFIVADGMGGHAAGEVASDLASDEFRLLASADTLSIDQVSATIARANEAIVVAANSSDEFAGMGTTLVGMVLVEDNEKELWLAFNVGDSRLYRWFDSELELVSVDHSEVQELVDEGAISERDARHHSQRNVITRALGIERTVEPDFWLLPPVPGERFLLCSDGLTGEIDDAEIAQLLDAERDPSVAATRLVESAVAAGGHDNVTVVVIDVLEAADADEVDTANRRTLPVTKVPIGDAPVTPPGPPIEMIHNVPLIGARVVGSNAD